MKIAVLAGDGIGTEIVAEAVKVLKALDLKMDMESALVGGGGADGCAGGFRAGDARPANRVPEVGHRAVATGALHATSPRSNSVGVDISSAAART